MKPSSGSIQDDSCHAPPQPKGKKRYRTDLSRDSNLIVRGNFSQAEDGDSDSIRAQVAKITEKGLFNSIDVVENLVSLLFRDRNERKIDWAGRILLSDAIAATEAYDPLHKFVELGGVAVLDDWVQEAHRGKSGDAVCLEESSKHIDALSSLLLALDKLPINLNALQTSSIGKSVNNLRGHKNVEIQKKARSLVDTWKKRAGAEMRTIDMKSAGSGQDVAWSEKNGSAEASHAGSKCATSTETVKSHTSQPPELKNAHSKHGHADAIAKPNTMSSGNFKLQLSQGLHAANSARDSVLRTTDSSVTPNLRRSKEKSNCSSQSQNNSQSCSSDQAKTVVSSSKEEARSSSVLVGVVPSGNRKETSMDISGSCSRAAKRSPHALTCKKRGNMAAETCSSRRLVVKITKPGLSPARSTSGGSFDDLSTTGSRTSSPNHDKIEQADCKGKPHTNCSQSPNLADVNAESWQSNDEVKGVAVCDEGDGIPSGVPDDEHSRTADETAKENDASKTACFSSRAEEPVTDKDFETTVSLPVGDDGMNLLASVAAGEISKSGRSLPSASPTVRTLEPGSCDKDPKSQLPCIQSYDGNLDIGRSDCKIHDFVGGDEIRPVGVKYASHDRMNRASGNVEKHEINDAFPEKDHQDFPSGRGNPDAVETPAKLDCETAAKNDAVKLNHSLNGTNKSYGDGTSKLLSLGCSLLVGGQICTTVGRHVQDSQLSNHKLAPVPMKHREVMDRSDDAFALQNSSKSSPTESSVREIKITDTLAMKSSNEERKGRMEQEDHSSSGTAPLVELVALSQGIGGTQATDHKVSHASPVVERKLKLNPGSSRTSANKVGGREEHLCSADETSTVVDSKLDVERKIEFDLNETFLEDGRKQSDSAASAAVICSSGSFFPNMSPFMSPSTNSFSAPITVATPAKRPFIPFESLSKKTNEPGWKGSAATSAFCPAEPRKISELTFSSVNTSSSDASGKMDKITLDLDLNAPYESSTLEDVGCLYSSRAPDFKSKISSLDASAHATDGFDLDLNKIDEGVDNVLCFNRSNFRSQDPFCVGRGQSLAFDKVGTSVSRILDLNDPGFSEVNDPAPRSQGTTSTSIPPFVPSSRMFMMSGSEQGNYPWYPPGNPYTAIATPPFYLGRGDATAYSAVPSSSGQRIMSSVPGGGQYGNSIYMGSQFSSGPAISVPPAVSFPYAGFPFDPSFNLASTSRPNGPAMHVNSSAGSICYRPMPSSLSDLPAGPVISHYPRPYFFSIPECSANGSSHNNQAWNRQGLDLNCGPGSTETDYKDAKLPPTSWPLIDASSRELMDETVRIYQASGGVKRKDPEGGYDVERCPYKKF